MKSQTHLHAMTTRTSIHDIWIDFNCKDLQLAPLGNPIAFLTSSAC